MSGGDLELGGLRIGIPAGFAVVSQTEETAPLLNIPGATTVGLRCRLEDNAGRSVSFERWSDGAPRPGEPLRPDREWTVDRGELGIRACRELAPPAGPGLLHAWFRHDGADWHVVAVRLDDGEFDRLLASIRPATGSD